MSARQKIVVAKSERIWRVGRRRVFSVHLRSGRSIRATGLHRLFSRRGWWTIADLAVGDEMAVAESPPKLWARASSDLVWDRIAAIEPAGDEEVFDLTVPGPACWLADGIVSHNSGALEQDADLILFLYRQSVYKEELPPDEANIAEVIIGKQRNGPIGTVKVVFLPQYARFENIADLHRQPQPAF